MITYIYWTDLTFQKQQELIMFLADAMLEQPEYYTNYDREEIEQQAEKQLSTVIRAIPVEISIDKSE